jgi:hypothetical protein
VRLKDCRSATAIKAAVERSHRRPATDVLYEHLKRTGRLARLLAADSPETERDVRLVARFFEVVRTQGDALPDARLSFLVPQLDALIEAGEDPAATDPAEEEPVDAVAVSTVHKAKGLEFGTVFLCGLVEDRFPLRQRSGALSLPDALVGAAVSPDEPFGSANGSGRSMRLPDTDTSAFSMRPLSSGRRSDARSTSSSMSWTGSPTRISVSSTASRGSNCARAAPMRTGCPSHDVACDSRARRKPSRAKNQYAPPPMTTSRRTIAAVIHRKMRRSTSA